ncbi:MAG: hypothetical protein HC790_07585 [Acaryochloridaceae cyanobacterium CSU_3_4]|nr:hypothetical protein [Acaryochloridaceae cyanobacterium CSU_3_4]
MTLLKRSSQRLLVVVLVGVLLFTSACTGIAPSSSKSLPPARPKVTYQQLQQGNTPAGQGFAEWVLQTAGELVSDAYVRDNDKLGVVITNTVVPTDVKPLARSLVQGFRRNFPNQDLTVLMYAPDKKLILTANYDTQSQQVKYE